MNLSRRMVPVKYLRVETHSFTDISLQQFFTSSILSLAQLNDLRPLLSALIVEIKVDNMDGSFIKHE